MCSSHVSASVAVATMTATQRSGRNIIQSPDLLIQRNMLFQTLNICSTLTCFAMGTVVSPLRASDLSGIGERG